MQVHLEIPEDLARRLAVDLVMVHKLFSRSRHAISRRVSQILSVLGDNAGGTAPICFSTWPAARWDWSESGMPSASMKWPTSKDAQGSRDDAQDIVRVWDIRPWKGFSVRHGFYRHVREHQPPGRSDGAVVAPVYANARRDPGGHGFPRPNPLLHPPAGSCQK
jgi:hypothetical protein